MYCHSLPLFQLSQPTGFSNLTNAILQLCNLILWTAYSSMCTVFRHVWGKGVGFVVVHTVYGHQVISTTPTLLFPTQFSTWTVLQLRKYPAMFVSLVKRKSVVGEWIQGCKKWWGQTPLKYFSTSEYFFFGSWFKKSLNGKVKEKKFRTIIWVVSREGENIKRSIELSSPSFWFYVFRKLKIPNNRRWSPPPPTCSFSQYYWLSSAHVCCY